MIIFEQGRGQGTGTGSRGGDREQGRGQGAGAGSRGGDRGGDRLGGAVWDYGAGASHRYQPGVLMQVVP